MRMKDKKPVGKLKAEQIRMTDLPTLPAGAVDAFEKLSDLTGTISDVCDVLGIACTISAMTLPPVNPGKRMVGPALTVRNVARSAQIHKAASEGRNTMGETEAHNISEPGDVLVIEGLTGCSNLGGQSSTIGRRQGQIGAIVDGTLRDPGHYQKSGWPVWCRGFTPITGKWRLETVEINGAVQIAGIQVNPGDLVCADDAGICFIPHAKIAEVLALCIKYDEGDNKREAAIAAGASVEDLVKTKYR
jgi:4-hydroxy-4-methyl-2-oxoglutarate aldolase